MNCDVGHRLSLDPELLWLWRRLAAIALITPLAWEPPCATGAALGKAKRQKKKKTKTKKKKNLVLRTCFLQIFCLLTE